MPDDSDEERTRHARDSAGNTAERGVAKALSELARDLQAEPDMASLLQHIVASLVEEISGADYGGITLYDTKKVSAVAATSPLVEHLDQLQQQLNEGPCLSSLREQVTIRSDNFATEDRWPEFVAAARAEGVQSMLSVQLFVEGDNLGALNLYATAPDVYTSADESTAMALAAHAAVAMKGSRIENNLRRAVASRDIIGQAKGILMERFKISDDEAFRLLVLSSQRTQTKLRDTAEHLTTTGELRTG